MKCYNCGEDYERVSLHWRRGSCDYPTLTERQRQISIGLIMGDGYVKRREGSPCQIRAEMNNKKFLEWIHGELNPLSSSVYLHRSKEENADRNNASIDGYHDSYLYISCTAPTFNEFGEWYDGGKKSWPDIELTPLSASVLYCCDGTLDGSRPVISSVNEKNRPEYVESMFEDLDVSAEMKGHHVRLGKEFFDIIPGPLPGFSRKWPESVKWNGDVE